MNVDVDVDVDVDGVVDGNGDVDMDGKALTPHCEARGSDAVHGIAANDGVSSKEIDQVHVAVAVNDQVNVNDYVNVQVQVHVDDHVFVCGSRPPQQ